MLLSHDAVCKFGCESSSGVRRKKGMNAQWFLLLPSFNCDGRFLAELPEALKWKFAIPGSPFKGSFYILFVATAITDLMMVGISFLDIWKKLLPVAIVLSAIISFAVFGPSFARTRKPTVSLEN
ncbi:hypothetical protein PRIPAC_97330 [Pristionchus pacificus]|uniref:Uncharacterized protein n=1 Tax=Pristionchus pacificus TaxID=54126 RepID=A0A2A6BCA6_PRIPA|nr:hypothetical protein PRIPAC_97330 [Pristionchus pacificus]|eukprot:PDM63519.1 hypothetical protein PRIPAC_53876 [Pristionchus pacificus]